TGSTNLAEINYARQLGMDVIVTDHHTLPSDRPNVTAIINPRSLPADHPLATLSGVAVAYKLVEALYLTLPDVPTKPLESLLDLVAIGLIADLVELKGDCRYLAQKGIQQLQRHTRGESTRPGIAKLLELCRKTGDRPTDISFGIGPRINAISRIHGDARFCVELLTSSDGDRCHHLALETELANTRRKALQKDVVQDVTARVAQLDLSTTDVIVLADAQWPVGVLGLVAGQIAREYARPTILLITDAPDTPAPRLARGSARSVNGIDLYQLLSAQAHLLQGYGGHPFAAGLSLPEENLPLFTEAINRQFRQQYGAEVITPVLKADLTVTVADLGADLFKELKLIEPCGMGNPAPILFIANCWFENVWNQNLKDVRGRKVSYIKTTFQLWDDTATEGFPGVWWEHYKDEVPSGRCDVLTELDFNSYSKQYELRLIAIRPAQSVQLSDISLTPSVDWILDWRGQAQPVQPDAEPILTVNRCPRSWADLTAWFRRALREESKLAIAYPPPATTPPVELWQTLVGVAKYLSRMGNPAKRVQLLDKLGVGDRPLHFGIRALQYSGFTVTASDAGLHITYDPEAPILESSQIAAIEAFFAAIQEERFQQQYFYTVPIATIQAIARGEVGR
ncbi:MAG: single-stranded-DNA-specific exonuclease RecJ, partial [Synechococcales cyanobacterium T60_A2020_003]|nr:single-stranded-DNA-specific exonuclease RecJ [Synechococcales cyanobacterium T60_A2020_003]